MTRGLSWAGVRNESSPRFRGASRDRGVVGKLSGHREARARRFPPFFLAAVRCTVASCFLLVLLARSSSETIRGLGPGAAGVFLVLGTAGIWGSSKEPVRSEGRRGDSIGGA